MAKYKKAFNRLVSLGLNRYLRHPYLLSCPPNSLLSMLLSSLKMITLKSLYVDFFLKTDWKTYTIFIIG